MRIFVLKFIRGAQTVKDFQWIESILPVRETFPPRTNCIIWYLSYQDTFVWRKITFLWSDSKNWGDSAPLAPPPSHSNAYGQIQHSASPCAIFIFQHITLCYIYLSTHHLVLYFSYTLVAVLRYIRIVLSALPY